jgi:DNA-binding CsgD family transcriptional regulator
MHAVTPLTSVLDRVYAPAATNEQWLANIHDALTGALAGHVGVQVYTMGVRNDGIEVDTCVANDDMLAAAIVHGYRCADASSSAIIKGAGPVLHAAKFMRGDHPTVESARQHGVTDVVLALGSASVDRFCVASFLVDGSVPHVPRSTRNVLARLAAHLGAAYRLRLPAGHEQDGDAVLSPKGELLHASGGAKTRSAQDYLRAAACAIVHSKGECERDPAAGLAFWKAMVDGRWTLVERTESDGKRVLIARRNQPATQPHRVLSERERIVLERASLGAPVRHLAYELGLAESTVSETIARAMRKIGIRDRSELVELRAAIVGDAAGG